MKLVKSRMDEEGKKGRKEKDKGNMFERIPDDMVELFSDAIAGTVPAGKDSPGVVYRMAGDAYLLVEYGEMVLDLNTSFRVHALDHALKENEVQGVLETAPGIRSLLIKYDGFLSPLKKLLEELYELERSLPPLGVAEVSSRIVYLPIAYHDRWNKEAIERYMKTIRRNAPYLPDNMEFVARCNALEGVEEVIKHHTSTQHMVLALGDVYLGAPCAVPLDPRYRLVVPKYNPARVWTPEGAVGIGGSYVCIYPMESPGGYQLIGRTVPIWNTNQTAAIFTEAPWLLRPFDRIQFEAVSEQELEEIRESFVADDYQLRIEEGTFSLAEYNVFLNSIRKEAGVTKKRQLEAAIQWTKGY
jgi:urea carboxylase